MPALAGRLEPHQLVRATLPVLRRRLDEAALAALIAPVRAPLCLIFSGLRPQLSADEATRADALSARLTSHLTHNLPMQELVWRAYASWLAAVHAALPLCIVIDDLAALDASSLAVLEQLLALDPATLRTETDTLFTSVVLATRKAALAMREQGGVILNCS
ncbi:MAG TPA: hypothetical protein VFP84_31425, partial [Kofleriaceae bacterium]|nr:hypothetical protein [Kofleriaceae bacterium]